VFLLNSRSLLLIATFGIKILQVPVLPKFLS
jgi:hypothetical protein